MSYVSLQKSQLLNSLENQVLYSDICSVITGQEGLGKSFLVQQLVCRVNEKVHCSQIEAVAELSVEQLEKTIALQVGLSWESEKSSLIERFNSQLESRVLLIIDDAQFLTLACLEYLISLTGNRAAPTNSKIFIILLGEPELVTLLQQTQPLQENPELFAAFELEPIQVQEAKYLIAEFQSIEVGEVESLYDAELLAKFWLSAQGNPAEIIQKFNLWSQQSNGNIEPVIDNDRTEQEAVIDSSSSSESSLVQFSRDNAKESIVAKEKTVKEYALIALYSFVAVCLIMILVYQDEINLAIEASEQKPVPENKETSEQLETPVSAVQLDAKKSSQKKNDFVEEMLAVQKIDKLITTDASDKSKLEPNATQTPLLATNKPVQQSSQQNKSEPEVNVVNRVEHKEKVEIIKKDKKLVLSEASLEEKGKTTSRLVPVKLTEDEVRLNQFSDVQFTLQWVALSTLKAAKKYRTAHPLNAQMMIFRRQHKSGYLYLIVSGQFNSRDDADNARAIYARRGYKGKPWVKDSKAVKAEISSIIQ